VHLLADLLRLNFTQLQCKQLAAEFIQHLPMRETQYVFELIGDCYFVFRLCAGI
jgi:hypothetical protein